MLEYYCENMKNVTVSLDDASYSRARVKAAQAGRSLSSMVREYLETVGSTESEFERLKRLQQQLFAEMDARGQGLMASENLTRDEVHDRKIANW